MAVAVALVIVGGIRSIARVTSKLVPFMAVLYVLSALAIIGINADRLPGRRPPDLGWAPFRRTASAAA